MSGRLNHLLPVIILVLLAGLTLWLRYVIEPPASPDASRERHEPDAVVDRFTVTQLDPDGAVRFQISAKRMIHYPDNNATELIEPKLGEREPGATLTITSERGVIEHEYKEAHFYDNVELVKTAAGEADELRVKTQYLHVMPQRDVVGTDRRVVITQGDSVLSGTGMEYNRKTGRLTVLSGVKGTFDVNRR